MKTLIIISLLFIKNLFAQGGCATPTPVSGNNDLISLTQSNLTYDPNTNLVGDDIGSEIVFSSNISVIPSSDKIIFVNRNQSINHNNMVSSGAGAIQSYSGANLMELPRSGKYELRKLSTTKTQFVDQLRQFFWSIADPNEFLKYEKLGYFNKCKIVKRSSLTHLAAQQKGNCEDMLTFAGSQGSSLMGQAASCIPGSTITGISGLTKQKCVPGMMAEYCDSSRSEAYRKMIKIKSFISQANGDDPCELQDLFNQYMTSTAMPTMTSTMSKTIIGLSTGKPRCFSEVANTDVNIFPTNEVFTHGGKYYIETAERFCLNLYGKIKKSSGNNLIPLPSIVSLANAPTGKTFSYELNFDEADNLANRSISSEMNFLGVTNVWLNLQNTNAVDISEIKNKGGTVFVSQNAPTQTQVLTVCRGPSSNN